jgi:hypothetical protein
MGFYGNNYMGKQSFLLGGIPGKWWSTWDSSTSASDTNTNSITNLNISGTQHAPNCRLTHKVLFKKGTHYNPTPIDTDAVANGDMTIHYHNTGWMDVKMYVMEYIV